MKIPFQRTGKVLFSDLARAFRERRELMAVPQLQKARLFVPSGHVSIAPMIATDRAISFKLIGSVTAEVVSWRMDGTLRATIVVKALFGFVPEQPMRSLASEPLVRAEVSFHRHPARSVERAIELAPYLPFADVILTGHAHAPTGTTSHSLDVRLGIFGHEPILTKTIHVHGDDGGEVPSKGIPLVYERAYGGLGSVDNPFGMGAAAGSKAPNLVHPDNPQRAAGFGPIGRTWPARKRLLGNTDRRVLDGAIAEIPNGFNFSYFQAAPLDQRIPYLVGNEWIVLEGMNATWPVLRSRLPTAQAVARVYGPDKPTEGEAISFTADMLRIDADDLRCAVIWRGNFLPSADLSAYRCVAGVETETQPLVWPNPDELAVLASQAEIASIEIDDADLISLDSTMTVARESTHTGQTQKSRKPIVIVDEVTSDVAHRVEALGAMPLPFAAAPSLRAAATQSLESTPWASRGASLSQAVPLTDGSETIAISRDDLMADVPPRSPTRFVPAMITPPVDVVPTRSYEASVSPSTVTTAQAPPPSVAPASSLWRDDEARSVAPAAPVEAAKAPPRPTVAASFPKLQNDLYGRFRKP